MSRRVPIRGGFFAWIIFTLLALCAVAEESTVPGVVVLRNGNVLSGKVDPLGDSYRITAETSSILVPADQVDIVCRSLKEAFQIKRGRIGPSIQRKCELVRWCLRQDLLAEAAREILEIRAVDARNLAIPSLELQLRQCLELRTVKSAARAPRPSASNGVLLASATESLPTPPISIDVQTKFIRSIQPMLLHNCTTGGCHQRGSPEKMHLDRWALEGGGNPALVRSNLDAVLAQLDKQDPLHSALLERARTVHGKPNRSSSRPLSALQATLLLNWLNEAAGVSPETTPAPEEPEAAQEQAALFDDDAAMLDPELGLQPAEPISLPKFKPRDAFDPEIFNRRHAKRAFTGVPASITPK